MSHNRVALFLALIPVVFGLALVGCGDSDPAGPGTTEIDTVPPGVPTALSVSGTQTAVNITWTANAEADLAGYELQKSLDDGVTWASVSETLLEDAEYTDAYHGRVEYRVAALDVSDNQSAFTASRQWIYVRGNSIKNPAQPLNPDF